MKYPTRLSFIIPLLFTTASAEYEWIGGYEPKTLVADHAAIDLDQKEIELLLRFGRINLVKEIYEEGGYSQSIARLKVIKADDPPTTIIPSGTMVIGENESGQKVKGRLINDFIFNATTKEDNLLVEYTTSSDPQRYHGCQVGALTSINSEKKDGCFTGTGKLQIIDPPYQLEYFYSPKYDNINGRTIQKFSILAKEEMGSCKNCPYPDFLKFFEYYGSEDYGDRFIQSAFDEVQTQFENGNADFSRVGLAGVEVAVEIAAKFMNVWMYVIRMMEHALDQCELPCDDDTNCGHELLSAWDQAVAYYVGSLEEDGVLLFAFADQMCLAFHSCGSDGSMRVGTSYTNNQVIKEFKSGQENIQLKKCSLVRGSKERIVELMTIPLIQATLFMAYIQGIKKEINDEDPMRNKVRGASFAASILPIIHYCNEDDATIIYENMGLVPIDQQSSKTPDFQEVKRAFEKNYDCMGVTCESVGGIWDGNDYGKYASPCTETKIKDEPMISVTLLISILLLVVLGIAILGQKYFRRCRTRRNKERTSTVIPELYNDDIRTLRSID